MIQTKISQNHKKILHAEIFIVLQLFLTLFSMAYEIPWQPWGGASNAPPPMEMAPEYPRLMKIGTQVPQGMPTRFPNLF